MPSALGGTGLQATDLTTVADVKALMGNGLSVSTSIDSEITKAISQVSAEITNFLGFHTLQATRTEDYSVRHGKRVLTLDARPIVTLSSLKVAGHPNDLATATDVQSRDYVVHKESGWIEFTRRMSPGGFFVRAAYVGGLGASTNIIVANRKDISFAAALQVKYYLQRRDSVGGNITTFGGANTQFNSQYGLLNEVRSLLSSHRRGVV